MTNLLKSISYTALSVFLCLMMGCAKEEKLYPQIHQNKKQGSDQVNKKTTPTNNAFTFESLPGQGVDLPEARRGIRSPISTPIPPSPVDNTYAYAVSGVPILLNFTYTDLDPNYTISLKFTAGEYWYKFLWDYGPDQVKKISLRLVDIETGEIQDTPYYDAYIGFYGHGWRYYADCQTPDNWSPALWKGYKVTQVTILGSEGEMFVGPTAPMWLGRTEETLTWQ